MAKKVKLENYIHIQNGYAFKSNLFQNFGVPVVRITNVENGKLNLDKVVYYSEDKKLDKFFIKNNDILLSLTGDDKTLKVHLFFYLKMNTIFKANLGLQPLDLSILVR